MKIDEDAFGARAFAADPGDGHAADDVGPDHPMRCGCAEQAVPVFAHLLDRGVATPTAVNRKDIGGDHVNGAHAIPARRASFHARSTNIPSDADTLSARVDEALPRRSEEHTSELQSLMRISYAVFCLK